MRQGSTAWKADRRTALKLMAASAALAACREPGARESRRVAVVGAGIVGASIAYHLAKAGAEVVILEREDEVAARCSRGTFAWINASWAKQPRSYHRLNQMGSSGWTRLEGELDLPIRWGGSVEWFESEDRQDRLAGQIAEQADWGEPVRMVEGPELRALMPNVEFGGVERAAFSGNDGALDPVLATRRLIRGAEALGAELVTGCEVMSVSNSDKRVVLGTSTGKVEVDRYVLATGADPVATASLAGRDVPQRSTPGVIVVTTPLPPLLDRILVAPGVHVHQRRDGRVVLGEQDGAPDTEAHAERLRGRPTRFPDSAMAELHAGRILETAEAYVPDLAGAEVEAVFIGWRPLPLDGHPVLGPTAARPESYIAIAHSGVTLAPVIGELVAEEIVGGTLSPMLNDYRPGRAFKRVVRY